MNGVVAIVGPTGIGKSRLALHIARIFNGEIVSADSRQVYRYLDIGTAKPSTQELALYPHHLVNTLNPDEVFSLGQYQRLAYRAIENIMLRDRLPLLVGGSGLYIWAVLEGWKIPAIPPDPQFRQKLTEKAAKVGEDKLYQELVNTNPLLAEKIDRRNIRRVVRALEVLRSNKDLLSQPQRKKAPNFKTKILGLTTDRKELYRRIDTRVDDMIRKGFVGEVEGLVKMGYDPGLPAMSGIGYRQISRYLKGELTLEVAVQQIKSETHRFVRQQYNWFRLKDDRIEWFDVQSMNHAAITALVAKFTES